ncbi:Bardet-Biedl syndrome 2 protein-like [Anthonomus grandis grandis]|uniref:Bardet-Biedl syndrome 2 protein-like n=1 Tax=Anthonomus grandis grandis TaxID=2921223 RepID=UPI002166A36C|nr:Bardet-Biedl syndrome 2 protein-like [Anthonomus grandis grandis]
MERFKLRPVFTLHLGYKIIPGLVTIGKYDGTHPCLTAATNTDKVVIHSPHRRNPSTIGKVIWSESNKEIALLNINQTITVLEAGSLIPGDDKDLLIIGTATNLLIYHVHDNKDIFYMELEDGVRSATVGTLKNLKTPIVLIGGNSSIKGFNHMGEEIFWIAIGDVVTSIIIMDCENNNQLIASSEDFKIRVLSGEETIMEYNESEVVSGLIPLVDQKFGYSVSNGTLGVYQKDSRLWRVKSKNFAISMHQYDLLGQPSPQLMTGWSNGKIDCRSLNTGEVLFKDSMSSSIAGITEGDYRSSGKNDLICVSTEGEVRGYTTTKMITNGENGVEQEAIRELLSRKQGLLMELKHYEHNAKYNTNVANETESYEASGVISSNTRMQIVVSTNLGENGQKPHVELYVCMNNTTIIRAVIIFAEGIFKGESYVVHPETSRLKSDMYIPLFLPRDNAVDIHLKISKALVGYPNSIQFHVFEITKQLPPFSMYALKDCSSVNTKPEGFVQFKITERLQRICMWINQNFIFPNDLEFDSGPNLTVNIQSLRDNTELVMVFEISGKTTFFTNNMFLAADLIQSLSGYLKLENLQSKASFPRDEANLKNLMLTLSEIQEARLKLGTDVADRLAEIRHLIIQAEDSRLNDIKGMKMHYNALSGLNKDLISGYNIKVQNYNEGIEAMKKINGIIQKASRLRVGQNSTIMINHCRNAIKNNNIEGLIKIIRTGEQ